MTGEDVQFDRVTRRDYRIEIIEPEVVEGFTLENRTLDEVFDFMHDRFSRPGHELLYEISIRKVDRPT